MCTIPIDTKKILAGENNTPENLGVLNRIVDLMGTADPEYTILSNRIMVSVPVQPVHRDQ